MSPLIHRSPLDPDYPRRLRSLEKPPATITLRGGVLDAERTVAIVGSRQATAEARGFARELARELARAGVVIVSGGAQGVDAAAHEGALAIAGRTWVVAGTGHLHCFPQDHVDLFETIGHGPGAVLWPFAPDFHHRSGFLTRNQVLVALSDAVVVVQAGLVSGALHAAGWARKLGRPLWVVPAAPWALPFAGSCRLLDEGARPLVSVGRLMGSFGLATRTPSETGDAPAFPLTRLSQRAQPETALDLSPREINVLNAIPTEPLHVDAIAARASLGAQAASVALLTLALEDVVVEGPPGFFRRRDSR